MQKTYSVKLYKLVINTVLSVFAAIAVAGISTIFLEMKYAYIIFGVVLVLGIWLMVFDSLLKITIDGNEMRVKKGRKLRSFPISQCSYSAVSRNAGRSDSAYSLTVTKPDGEQESIDCDLLGYRQFNSLLEDLGVLGAKAGATKLETKKEGEE